VEGGAAADPVKQFHPTAERTKAALASALRPFLPATGLVLELGSGSGQHVAHLASVYPSLRWQASDADEAALASIAAYGAAAPIRLDVTQAEWPVERADCVLASYLAHVLDDDGKNALFRGAGRVLAPGGRLFVFGPLAASRTPVPAPAAALRGSIWCPVTEIPDRASLDGIAARHGLRELALVAVGGDSLLVFGTG